MDPFEDGMEGTQDEGLGFPNLSDGLPGHPVAQAGPVEGGEVDMAGESGFYEPPLERPPSVGSGSGGGLSLGRPPLQPMAGDPEPLRRMTSGLNSSNTPNWADVETELRQRTLTDFLRRMFDTLTKQHEALDTLNNAFEGCAAELNFLKGHNEDKSNTLHAHASINEMTANRLGKIESDIGMAIRDTGNMEERVDGEMLRISTSVNKSFFQDQIEKKSLRQTVDELAMQHNKLCNVVRRERYGRLRVTGWMLADLNLKGVLRRFFSKWQTWSKMGYDIRQANEGREAVAMVALTDARRGVHRRYFQKLLTFVQWARQQHTKADIFRKAIRSLNYMRTKHLFRRYYDKLRRFLAEEDAKRDENYRINVEKAGITADISMKSLMVRYFNKILGKRNLAVQLRKKGELCDQLGKMCLGSLRQRYYGKLYAFLMWTRHNRKRRQQAADLNAKHEERIRRTFLHKWAHHAACIRRHLERVAVSRALNTKNEQVVRREYYHLLFRYQTVREKARDRHELENRFAEAGRKTDNLGTQIDVGLKTLSNTNSVLNKLVDRLITVDDQLGSLEKEKVSRRELSFITDPGRHPEIERPPPSPRRMAPNDPRTSPTVVDTPLERYAPEAMAISTTERQRDMDAERERDLLIQRQQTQEMEENHRNLQRIMAAMPMQHNNETPVTRPQPFPQYGGQDDSRHDHHPQITPFRQSATPSSQFEMDLQAEFEQEQQTQMARYRSMSDVTSGRFV